MNYRLIILFSLSFSACGADDRYAAQTAMGIKGHCKEFKENTLSYAEHCPENAVRITSDLLYNYFECAISTER